MSNSRQSNAKCEDISKTKQSFVIKKKKALSSIPSPIQIKIVMKWKLKSTIGASSPKSDSKLLKSGNQKSNLQFQQVQRLFVY